MINFTDYSKNYINFYTDEIPKFFIDLFEKNKSNFSVLDLGCGDGSLFLSLYNKGYFQNAKRIVGVDLSPERIERFGAQEVSKLELICSDACEVKELQDSSFDYIFNNKVIEHVPDDEKLLLEIHRLLKETGILYISSVIKKRYGWYFYRCNGRWTIDPTHLREYSSEKEFINIVESVGFKLIKSRIIPFKFTPVDFIIRRIYSPIFRPKNINSFFLRHKILNKLRAIKIPISGYYIVDVLAEKT